MTIKFKCILCQDSQAYEHDDWSAQYIGEEWPILIGVKVIPIKGSCKAICESCCLSIATMTQKCLPVDINQLKAQLTALTTTFNEYSAGVQKVYAYCHDLKEKISAEGLDERITVLSDLKNAVARAEEYVASPKVERVYEFMNKFKDSFERLIEEMAELKDLE